MQSTLFRNRVFIVVTFSDLLQHSGIWIRNMALLFFVLEHTNQDPVAVSILTVCQYAPIFLFSVIGGVFADRWNPKRTMIVSDILTVISIGLIALFLDGYWIIIYLVTLLSAIFSQFSQPASIKIFKQHIPKEQVATAVGINQSLAALFVIAGPIVGTLIYGQLGIYYSLFSLIAIFLISPILLSFLPSQGQKETPSTNTSLSSDIREGYQFLVADPTLKRLIFILAIIGLGAGLIQPLEVFIVTDRLGLEETAIQWFNAIDGIGLLIGSAIAAVMVSHVNERLVLFIGISCLSVSAIVEAFSIWPLLTGSMRFLNALFLSFVNILLNSFLIRYIPEKLVGKVNGVITPLYIGSMLLSSSIAGGLMNWIGLIPVFVISAAICLLALPHSLQTRFQTQPLKADVEV